MVCGRTELAAVVCGALDLDLQSTQRDGPSNFCFGVKPA